LVPFPFSSDPTKLKVRPAIVISNSSVNSSRDIILAGITSHLWQDKFSFPLDNSMLTQPLPRASEIRCHYLFTVEKTVVIKEISLLDKAKQFELFEKKKSLLEPTK